MAASGRLVKVLACGDVKGRLSALLKRVEAVNRKAGPFEMVLCVGSFFEDNDSCDMVQADKGLWDDIKSGKKKVAVPLYILSPEPIKKKSDGNPIHGVGGCELAQDVICLGHGGCMRTADGLTIAYFSGGSAGVDGEAVENAVESVCVRSGCEVGAGEPATAESFRGVDILLTSDWPKGVAVSDGSEGAKPEGDPLIAGLAVKLKPRYHFAGLHGLFYERLPYRNHRVASEKARPPTRFIALGHVDNPAKSKWLYAFNIVPSVHMAASELNFQPDNVTERPFKESDLAYKLRGGSQGRGAAAQQFFFATNMEHDDDKKQPKKRRRPFDGEGAPDRKVGQHNRPKPTGPCWFCLSGAEVEKHLVVSVGDHSYVAMAKGGLTPHHVLVMPIAHFPSYLDLPDEVAEEIEKFKKALRKCFRKVLGSHSVVFERNFRSQHMQLQVLPVPAEQANYVKLAFEEHAEEQGLELSEMPEHASMTHMAEQGTPYFYVEIAVKSAGGSSIRLFHRIKKNGFPLQFGREVLASKAVLDIEERADWRACSCSKEDEAEVAKNFRKIFEPFDFSQQDDE